MTGPVMSAIEKIEQQFWRWPGPLSEAHADISRKDFRAALAEAWAEGRDDGLDDLGATQTAIDYGELTSPYEEES
jgi:hypothetical protein